MNFFTENTFEVTFELQFYTRLFYLVHRLSMINGQKSFRLFLCEKVEVCKGQKISKEIVVSSILPKNERTKFPRFLP